MARRITKLENIRVQSPCGADWYAMAGDERTRFCRECQKSVYHLSAMTREQAARLISESRGKLCARFSLRPDGTLLTLEPAAAPHAPRGRASRVAAATFTAVFSFCASAFAQSPARADESPARTSQQDSKRANMRHTDETRKKAAKLHGTVYDIERSVVPQVKVTLINESTRQERIVGTDSEGVFVVDGLEGGLYTLVAESPGFMKFKEAGLKLRAGERRRLDVTLQIGMMGEIVVVVDRPAVQNPALNFIVETLSLPYRGLRKIVKAAPR